MRVKYWLVVLTACAALVACDELSEVGPDAEAVAVPDVSVALIPEPPCEPEEITCGDGGGGGGGTPPPAPTGANLRVVTSLTKVYAKDTEDVTPTWPLKPTDEFYATGGIIYAEEATGFGPSRAFMTPMFKARKGSTYTRSDVLADVVVPPDTTVAMQFNAFDEDLAKNRSQIAAAIAAYAVGESIYRLYEDEPPAELGLVKPVLALIGAIASLDEDDNLGGDTFNVGTLRQNQSRTFTRTFRVERNDTEWWSEWDYDLTYTIKVTPTDNPLTPMD